MPSAGLEFAIRVSERYKISWACSEKFWVPLFRVALESDDVRIGVE